MWRRLLSGIGFLLYLLAVAVVFLCATYLAFSFFVRSGVTAVPQVVGLSRAEAANRLLEQGLELRRVDRLGRYDDKVPAGHIVRQSPEARTLVKRGSGVEVALSLGPRRVEVPNLTGKALPAAQVGLSALGLELGNILGTFELRRPSGSVLGQDPDPGAEVPPASSVHLLLAMPEPGAAAPGATAAASAADRYLMPDLVYRHYDEVRPYFERHGFRFGNVKFERYEGVAAGVILRQFPLPGHPLTRNDPVSLVVATADGAA